jgi:hypothetical protein
LVHGGFAPDARAIDQEPEIISGRVRLLFHHASE